LSLEFEEADLDRVRQCIRQLYPATTSRRAGIATLYSFGGCEFVFQNEWEDPCLISKSYEGGRDPANVARPADERRTRNSG
jgi:hypothetical protein